MALGVSMNPRDRGLVLVGYEGGVILWDMAKREVKGSFELVIMPGAPGASTYTDPVSVFLCSNLFLFLPCLITFLGGLELVHRENTRSDLFVLEAGRVGVCGGI